MKLQIAILCVLILSMSGGTNSLKLISKSSFKKPFDGDYLLLDCLPEG